MSLRPGVLFQTAPTLSTHQFHIWVHAGAGIERMALWQAIKKSKDTSVLVRSCKYRSNNVQLPKWYDGAVGADVYHTKPSGSLVTCVTGWSRGDRAKLGAVWHIPKLLVCPILHCAFFSLCCIQSHMMRHSQWGHLPRAYPQSQPIGMFSFSICFLIMHAQRHVSQYVIV